MKHLSLLLFFLIAFSGLKAQITITESDFPNADDTAMISISSDLALDYGTTGPSVNWDFSDLVIESQRIDTFYNVSDASLTYQVVFNNFLTEPDYDSEYYNNFLGFDLPGAGAAGISVGNTVVFTKYASSEVRKVGLGMNINGIEIPAKYEDIDTEYELPIDYMDSWDSYSFLDLDLNPAFNGILRRHQNRSSYVDGWGTITTPFGTFDALRVRSNLEYDDSVYVDLGLGGSWIELPTPDQTEYTWWSNGNKVPILRVVVSGTGGAEAVTRVEFKDMDRGFLSVEEEEIEVGIYPNPAQDELNIQLNQLADEIRITNLQGKIMYETTQPALKETISVSSWPKGIYLVQFNDESGSFTKKFVVQ